MTNKIYSIGIDPGYSGAIAFIGQYLSDSKVIPMPKAHPWLCPLPDNHENAFYKVGKNRGDRRFKTHDKWGCNIIFHDDIVDSICHLDLSLGGVQSYIEDPEAQGVGRAGLNNSKTVGLNIYPLIRSIQTITGTMPWSVTTKEWQSHPAIATFGKNDWGKGAKNKKEAKKHDAVTAANRIFDMNIPLDQDGLADALLIGLYGALKYPPVIEVDAVSAWVLLQSNWGFPSMPIDSDLPFTEALVYARRVEEDEYQEVKDAVYDRLNLVAPPLDELRQDGIVGKVTLGDRIVGDKKFWRMNEYAVTDKVDFLPVAFDMEGRSVKPYYHQPLGVRE